MARIPHPDESIVAGMVTGTVGSPVYRQLRSMGADASVAAQTSFLLRRSPVTRQPAVAALANTSAVSVVGCDGLRVAGAFGWLCAIVDVGADRVRVERRPPMEVARSYFDQMAQERRLTPFSAPLAVEVDGSAVVVYADLDDKGEFPGIAARFLDGAPDAPADSCASLIPAEGETGPNFRMAVCSKAAAERWASSIAAFALAQLEAQPLPSTAECWAIVEWLTFVVAHGAKGCGQNKLGVYAWLHALARTGQVPNVPVENVDFDLSMSFDEQGQAAVRRRSDEILERFLSDRVAASPSPSELPPGEVPGTLLVTCQILRAPEAPGGDVRVRMCGMLDDEDEADVPAPPGLPDWALDGRVFLARLDESVSSFAELRARPAALHSFSLPDHPKRTTEGLRAWIDTALPTSDRSNP